MKTEADEFLSLMTPVAKALFTDLGSECANLGVQVLGGHGYIRAHGMEQYVRDVRITQIYDGTNGIQALDLVKRKLTDGRLTRQFIAPTRARLNGMAGESGLREFVQPAADALAHLDRVAVRIVDAGMSDPEEAAAVATEFLRQLGLVALAGMWARMAAVALPIRPGVRQANTPDGRRQPPTGDATGSWAPVRAPAPQRGRAPLPTGAAVVFQTR